MGTTGRTLGTAGGAAIGTAIAPGVGTVVGGVAGGLLGGLLDSNNPAPAPGVANAQIGSNDIANQIAAQQVASGLQQQANESGTEAALYNQGNQNFDIANSAQMRGGPQISSSPQDLQNQQNALNATYGQASNLSNTGSQLTAMGTAAQGPSAAAAQLQQGQSAAMAQQLSMAHSGRSLGSGQAAMAQAAFNNSGINQATNQQAAQARIQEDAAYRNSQINALQSAAGAYGQSGGLAGQAGNLATGIRTGNEGVQTTNANLALQQEGVNNQTTGLYNQLGSAQQGLGMQANALGQNAQQFGANQGANTLQAQLNAGLGLNSQINQINLANQANANSHDAAAVNAVSSGLGAAATYYGQGSAPAPATPAAAPAPSPAVPIPGNAGGGSGQASSQAPNFGTGGPVTTDALKVDNNSLPASLGGTSTAGRAPMSDYRQKTNIQPMESPPVSLSDQLRALSTSRADHPPSLSSAPPPPTDAQKQLAAIDQSPYNPDGSLKVKPSEDTHYRGIPMPEGNVKTAIDGKVQSVADVTTPKPPPSPRSDYADALNMLNNGYQQNMSQPGSVLWRTPGANQQMGTPQLTVNHGINGYGPKYTLTQPDAPTGPAPAADTFHAPTYNQQYQAPEQYHASPPLNMPALPSSMARYNGPTAPHIFTASDERQKQNVQLMHTADPAGPEQRAGYAFGRALHDNVAHPNVSFRRTPAGQEYPSSDVHSKTRIRELEGQLSALSQGAPPTNGEQTQLSAQQQPGFQHWLQQNHVSDLDNPDSHYDYRGAYAGGVGRGASTGHFPDTYKQHGHPTFSIESQYSKNSNDGGSWDGERFSPAVRPQAPDTAALDEAYARQQQPPAIDLRPARGYSYEYKDPNMPGAAPGTHIGPMAQDLENTAAANTVFDTPTGKQVDTPRLTMTNTAAISELQRKLEALQAAQGPRYAQHDQSAYPTPQSPY